MHYFMHFSYNYARISFTRHKKTAVWRVCVGEDTIYVLLVRSSCNLLTIIRIVKNKFTLNATIKGKNKKA